MLSGRPSGLAIPFVLADIKLLINIRLHIVRWCGGTQYHSTSVFLFLGLEGIDLLGHFPGADDEQAGSQRIKRTCMPNFQLQRLKRVPQLANDVKAGPVVGLVH